MGIPQKTFINDKNRQKAYEQLKDAFHQTYAASLLERVTALET